MRLFRLNNDASVTGYDSANKDSIVDLNATNRDESPLFFRFGFYNYAKVNAERGTKQWLNM